MGATKTFVFIEIFSGEQSSRRRIKGDVKRENKDVVEKNYCDNRKLKMRQP